MFRSDLRDPAHANAADPNGNARDKAHSEVVFSILHMSLSKVHGRIGLSSGQIVWNEADVTKSTVNMTIDVNSVDTGVQIPATLT